jgi:hypothetical protein
LGLAGSGAFGHRLDGLVPALQLAGDQHL